MKVPVLRPLLGRFRFGHLAPLTSHGACLLAGYLLAWGGAAIPEPLRTGELYLAVPAAWAGRSVALLGGGRGACRVSGQGLVARPHGSEAVVRLPRVVLKGLRRVGGPLAVLEEKAPPRTCSAGGRSGSRVTYGR